MQCINRAQQSLLGKTGQAVLNTAAGVAPLLKASTIPLGPPVQVDTVIIRTDVRLAVTTRSLNALEASTNLAIGRGLLSPGAMAGIRAASPILAKASGYLTVAAITAEAGFVIACR